MICHAWRRTRRSSSCAARDSGKGADVDSHSVRLMWDDDHLYLFADVRDPGARSAVHAQHRLAGRRAVALPDQRPDASRLSAKVHTGANARRRADLGLGARRLRERWEAGFPANGRRLPVRGSAALVIARCQSRAAGRAANRRRSRARHRRQFIHGLDRARSRCCFQSAQADAGRAGDKHLGGNHAAGRARNSVRRSARCDAARNDLAGQRFLLAGSSDRRTGASRCPAATPSAIATRASSRPIPAKARSMPFIFSPPSRGAFSKRQMDALSPSPTTR